MIHSRLCLLFIASGLSINLVSPALGEEELTSYTADTPLTSGPVQNFGAAPATIFSGTIRVPDAPWIRLNFDSVTLSGNLADKNNSHLLITSLHDGAFQILDSTSLAQWQNTSAYFNGDSVRIELIAHPNTGPNQITIHQTIAGDTSGEIRTICGPTDDRVLSNDPRVARIVPVGCTGWLFNDENHCFLTAGHCNNGGLQVIQFNVPLSDSSGNLISPPPEDQYAVDGASVQSAFTTGGNDWTYFGCFPNSNTGLTPYQAMGSFFVISNPPAVSGQTLRVTGCGTTSSPVSPTWNQVQKTHAGPYSSLSGNVVRYVVDTTGGNSGSPVINENTGLVIAIHTNGGCSVSSGTNFGTGINNGNLQNALAHPLGVCENDPTPPTPNPMSFSIAPAAVDTASISMQAIAADDAVSPPVQYYFDFTGGSLGGTDSGWQTSRDYVDTGLSANSSYNYVVRARDSNLPSPNMTADSGTVSVSTPIETPTGISFSAIDDNSIVVNAEGTFTNQGLGSTGFYFEMTPDAGAGANVWSAGPSAAITGLTPCTQYTFRVKARNFNSIETAFVGPAIAYTTGCDGCILPGDMNGNGAVEGDDIAGFVRVKLGVPAGNEYALCADYGTGTVDGDTTLFVNDLIAK